MSFFHTLIRQLSAALALSLLCHTALAQSALRLEMRNDNIARFYDGSTVIWSGRLPDQMSLSCLQIALETPGATIVCPPHIARRLGLIFNPLERMPIQEQWEWQSYSARVTRDGPNITLHGAIQGIKTHVALSIFFWVFTVIIGCVLFWWILSLPESHVRRNPPR